jgi:hypothetical protein
MTRGVVVPCSGCESLLMPLDPADDQVPGRTRPDRRQRPIRRTPRRIKESRLAFGLPPQPVQAAALTTGTPQAIYSNNLALKNKRRRARIRGAHQATDQFGDFIVEDRTVNRTWLRELRRSAGQIPATPSPAMTRRRSWCRAIGGRQCWHSTRATAAAHHDHHRFSLAEASVTDFLSRPKLCGIDGVRNNMDAIGSPPNRIVMSSAETTSNRSAG